MSSSPTSVAASGTFEQSFDLKGALASGSSASVFKCVDRSAGRMFAAKVSRAEDCKWPWKHVSDMYEREAKLLRRVQGHPNVVQLAALYKESTRLYMVMELVNGGDLHTVLTRQRCLPEEVARAAFTQLVSAIDHLHANGVLHRDIKLENVLYDQTVSPAVIKVCDLGNSMLVESPPTNNFRGTNGYTAPEIGGGAPGAWTPKADVWALGVVLYAMLGGYLPFDDSRGRHSSSQYLDFSNAAWWNISVEAKLLIQAMLTPNTSERATLDDVIDSAWLASVDPSRLPPPVAPPPLHPVASMGQMSQSSNRLPLRSYRKPSSKDLSAVGSSQGISEDAVSNAELQSPRGAVPSPRGMGGAKRGMMGSGMMGAGMSRGRGSMSCNNMAALAGEPSTVRPVRPNGSNLSVEKTPDTSAFSAGGAEGAPGGEESGLSDLISRCRAQGMRMSITVSRGISSRPMQSQQQ